MISIFLTHVVLDVVDQWCDPIISVIMIVSEIGQIDTHPIAALKLKCLMFICIVYADYKTTFRWKVTVVEIKPA